MKQSDKKVSFDDPQNGGHFSCRKPVSHVGTSTVRLPCRVPIGERYTLLDLYFACATMDTNRDVFFDDHRVLQLVVITTPPSPSITWEGEKCLAFG